MELFNSYSFIGCEHSFDDADVVMFGAPFDGTCSFRPGSRFAGYRVRVESYGLETYSPYLDKDLLDKKVCDSGDLELPFGNKNRALDIIYEYSKQIIDANKKPLMIGGEHLVSISTIKALYEKYPDLVILHFDAHTDLREDYMGEPLSHATVIKRAWDLLGDNRIYQFGIRSGLKKEFDWANEGHTYLNKFDTSTLKDVVQKIKDKPVYVTIDLDILDPSIFPGTGTPEPGGIDFKEMIEAIELMSNLKIVGADVVELAPDYDPTGVSTAVACKVIREMLLCL
ncbi:agmatinase [Alkalithermobacter thermoalcaliphilus JW-YL-7 = DSM 7308]|uniref:Agmatinase n=1 Tax=Alkalithermobacter thermoalcaliphilus JW-YL-7 = DSM 7308 TaxID=1121328 RepID=A0A150FQQ1_CLOPD|nr:agmatinase [[Clostridium] paradoxum JW-YL-7 = DSM 7308]SHK77413.1 agmatinase [[Clostridium] paradoxum JW-YL-7 = DSM 7308]